MPSYRPTKGFTYILNTRKFFLTVGGDSIKNVQVCSDKSYRWLSSSWEKNKYRALIFKLLWSMVRWCLCLEAIICLEWAGRQSEAIIKNYIISNFTGWNYLHNHVIAHKVYSNMHILCINLHSHNSRTQETPHAYNPGTKPLMMLTIHPNRLLYCLSVLFGIELEVRFFHANFCICLQSCICRFEKICKVSLACSFDSVQIPYFISLLYTRLLINKKIKKKRPLNHSRKW